MEARELVSGEPSSHHMELSAIAKLLAGYAYRYGSETQLQDGLQRVLKLLVTRSSVSGCLIQESR